MDINGDMHFCFYLLELDFYLKVKDLEMNSQDLSKIARFVPVPVMRSQSFLYSMYTAAFSTLQCDILYFAVLLEPSQ